MGEGREGNSMVSRISSDLRTQGEGTREEESVTDGAERLCDCVVTTAAALSLFLSSSAAEDVRDGLRRLREDGEETEQGAGPAAGRTSKQEAVVQQTIQEVAVQQPGHPQHPQDPGRSLQECEYWRT